MIYIVYIEDSIEKLFHILSNGLVCALVSCFTLEMSICIQRLYVCMYVREFSSMGKFVIFHFWNISHYNANDLAHRLELFSWPIEMSFVALIDILDWLKQLNHFRALLNISLLGCFKFQKLSKTLSIINKPWFQV